MAKVMVPIIKLKHDETFSLDAYDVLRTSFGYQENEEFTFTFRLSVPDEGVMGLDERERVKKRLREETDQAEALIQLLDEHEWDVSFFVDTY